MIIRHLYIYCFTILITLSFFNKDRYLNNIDTFEVEKDSLSVWIEKANNRSLSSEDRKVYLDKAYAFVQKEANDTLKNKYLLKLSLSFYKLNDWLNFRRINKQSINLSINLKDSANLAINFWDLGNFYVKRGTRDSAFYAYSKAQKIYSLLKDDEFSGTMLLNMAIIQSDIKDYTGSDITTTKAIALLKPLNEYRKLYKCYNNLGINFNQLEEYDKAIFYHEKALEYQEEIEKDNTYKENTLNNIGVVYEKKLAYKTAIKYYKRALESEDLNVLDPSLYAKLLDNLAYSRLKLNDTLGINAIFLKSLKIRDSINDYLGVAINKLHLAEYYAFANDTLMAFQFAKETKELAKSTDNYRDLLTALLLLSKFDNENSLKYTNEYIKISDSLQKEERVIRDKFTRIRFETDEFIDENIRLNQQRNLIIIISGFMGVLSLLLFIIRNQHTKNRELSFEKQQQQANEEIYNLMISQQNKLDEGSRNEKKRISEELHDGVLGKLFGTRLILGSLNGKTDEETVLKREKYINDLKDIEEEVRNVSHELNKDSQLLNIGYLNMIENLLDERSKISNFTYKFKNDKNIVWKEINGALKMNLYRIIQEAIQNINKYAKAKTVTIEFVNDDRYLYLSIEDDGVGFNVSSKNDGIGLNNMKSRINKMGGEFSIKSEINKGTIIFAKIHK